MNDLKRSNKLILGRRVQVRGSRFSKGVIRSVVTKADGERDKLFEQWIKCAARLTENLSNLKDALDNQLEPIEVWVVLLKQFAEERGCGWLIDHEADYSDYFDDGLSIQEAFEEELSAAKQSM